MADAEDQLGERHVVPDCFPLIRCFRIDPVNAREQMEWVTVGYTVIIGHGQSV